MQYLGIEYQMKHAPKLDPTFIPFGVWRAAYLKGATKPLAIALERDKGRVSVHKTFIHGTPELAAKCNVTLPDEKMRRVGQSVAAASLPKVSK